MAVLEVEGLTKRFRSRLGRRVVSAVRGLDLSVEEGTVVAFVGPNGAGKTTTLLSILGFLRPDAGRISIFGEPAGSLPARARIGFQSESFHTYLFHTARRALTFYGRLSGVAALDLPIRVERGLERLGLAHAAERKIATFSKGMMQRLGLAQALLHEPDLLLLDEPTTGLDPEGRKLVAEVIDDERSRGRTVFLSSHILTDVERTCDRVLMIGNGELVLEKELRTAGPETGGWDIELSVGEPALAELSTAGFTAIEVRGPSASFRCTETRKPELLRLALQLGVDVLRVERRSETLEELYMKHFGGAPDG